MSKKIPERYKKLRLMKIADPEHSIINYLDYFIAILKKFRGDNNSIDKIMVKHSRKRIIIEYHGYDNILKELNITIKHRERADGKDMVIINVREGLRDLIESIKSDLDSPEPRYFQVEEEMREESGGERIITYPSIKPKPKKRVIWRLKDEIRPRIRDIYCRLDKDSKRIVSLLAQFPYGASEEEILMELRNIGYSKEDAYNIMLEKKEEFLDKDWIEIEG